MATRLILSVLFPDLDPELVAENLRAPIWAVMMAFVPAMLLSFLFTAQSVQLAQRHGVVARPSRRGSHDIPTPRIGGIGIAVGFYLAVILIHIAWGFKPTPFYSALLIAGGWAFVGGLLDDLVELPPRWKFMFQFACAGSVLLLGYSPRTLDFCGVELVVPWWGMGIIVFGFVVFFINAFNFMDGMDGQSGMFAFIVCATMVIALCGLRDYSAQRALPMLIVAALAGTLPGFLVFNLPTTPPVAKTFMGDCGSQFMGFLLALFCLRVGEAHSQSLPFTACLILISPYIWDVLFTLFRRTIRGENVLQAHRSHLYQRLLIARWTHGQVLLINTILWIGAALFALQYAAAFRNGLPRMQWTVLAGAAAWLIAYTITVIIAEKAAQRRLQFKLHRSEEAASKPAE